MTMLSKMVLIAASAGVLAGCGSTSLQGPAPVGYATQPDAPAAPRAPVQAQAAPAQAPMAAADEIDGPRAAPVGDVTAQPLPPLSAPVAASPAQSAARPSSFISDSDPQAQLILVSSRSRARLRASEKADSGPVKAKGRVESSAGATRTVVVKKGDTVKMLADRMQVSEKAIIKANRLRHPGDLDVGRKLKVPTSKAYVVEHGDTLYAISRRFSVPVPTLEEINGFEHGARLHPGQKVVLPGQQPEESPIPPARPVRSLTRTPPSRREQTYTPPVVEPETQPTQPPQTVAPPAPTTSSAAPRGPIPYTSLPGHLTGPTAQPPQQRYGAPIGEGTIAPPQRGMSPPVGPNGPPVVEAAPPPTDDQIVAAGHGRFVWPVQGETISGYGLKSDGQRNDGIDIGAPMNTPVVAAAAGDVVVAGDQVPGFGNLVLIRHPDGWVTVYTHLSSTEVKIKDHVSQGTEIGRVGETGGVTQPQLHFEIRYSPTLKDKARPVDPSLLLGAQ